MERSIKSSSCDFLGCPSVCRVSASLTSGTESKDRFGSAVSSPHVVVDKAIKGPYVLPLVGVGAFLSWIRVLQQYQSFIS